MEERRVKMRPPANRVAIVAIVPKASAASERANDVESRVRTFSVSNTVDLRISQVEKPWSKPGDFGTAPECDAPSADAREPPAV